MFSRPLYKILKDFTPLVFIFSVFFFYSEAMITLRTNLESQVDNKG